MKFGSANVGNLRLGSAQATRAYLGSTLAWDAILALQPALWLSDTGSDPSIWPDMSGNGRHAIQVSSTNQPAIITGGLNGRQVRRFDGVNDYFDHPLAINGGNNTIYVVGKKSGGSSYSYFFEASDAGSPVSTFIFARFYGNANWGSYSQGAGYISSGVEASTFTLMQSRYDGSSIQLRTNGGGLVTSSGALYGGDGVYRNGIGAFGPGIDPLNGEIAEILVFPTPHSDTVRQSVEAYLNAKWAIY